MEESILTVNNEHSSSNEVPAPSGILSGIMQDAVTSETIDPKLASLPRLLLMGPRRGGKTSIQVSGSQKRRNN